MSATRHAARRACGRSGRTAFIAAAVTVASVVNPSPMQTAAARASEARLPDTYVVSERAHVLPEGIGLGRHGTFYVTSSATGAVFRGNLHDRRMHPFLAAGSAGRHSALDVHVDAAGRVFVAGSTALDVYGPGGALLFHRPAPAGPVGPASLNDRSSPATRST